MNRWEDLRNGIEGRVCVCVSDVCVCVCVCEREREGKTSLEMIESMGKSLRLK